MPVRMLTRPTLYPEAALMSLFFFQAEDGIRDHCVTGVQTCALPIFKSEFAGNDFLKSNVGERSPRASLDHWPVPKTEVTHALGYNVDKQLRVGNYLAGFLQELSRHNAQGVDGAGRLRRELENRRRAGRNGTREKTRAEHRDEKEMVNVGSKRALVKRFVSSVFRMCPSTRAPSPMRKRIGHDPARIWSQ